MARIRLESARRTLHGALAIACATLLLPGDAVLLAQPAAPAAAPAEAKKLPPDQLDSLVAPIALYPDSLLAQTLAASTYPLELVQLQQWLAKNASLKDKALVDAVAKQPWDPSVQSMAAFPEVVKRLGDDVQWTYDLGNAFLAQQSDVMDAVQRMRKKAEGKGTLATNEQQKVETKVIEEKQVIVIESAKPDVIYVPSYDPVVVYGAPVYPYPSIYYPYWYPGAAFMSFGFGFAMGAFWGGMWGSCGWGSSNINVNVNNNFNRVEHHGGDRGQGNRGDRGQGNRGQGGRGQGNAGGGASWKHNPSHRGGTPYGDRATANKFGGTARGDSLSNRQASARQQPSRSGASNRASGAGGRGGAGVSDRSTGAGGRGGGASGGSSARSFDRGGSGDRIGGRDLGGGSRGSSGFSGSQSRASSSRGASSFGSRGGGGGGRR